MLRSARADAPAATSTAARDRHVSTLLLINPNTSTSVTDLMAGVMRPLLGENVELVTVTARFGASYIASETAYAIAAHAVLDAWAAFVAGGGRCDAICIGCFGDPGVAALREAAGVPVMGLAEAALREAAARGLHGIVTGGAAWRPMLERFAAANAGDVRKLCAGVQRFPAVLEGAHHAAVRAATTFSSSAATRAARGCVAGKVCSTHFSCPGS
jgi:Asp/Glu/hydantoin racemase